MLQHAIDLISELTAAPALYDLEKILVTTYNKYNHIKIPSDFKSMLNKNPEIGQSNSIKIGLKAATGDYFMFLPGDLPLLTVDDIKPLLLAATANKDKIIYPVIDGWPSAPTIFPSKYRDELMSLTDDNGGRDIRDENPKSCVAVNVIQPENFIEINSMLDYYKLFNKGES
jgi:molybdenum cofactor cytidylyltransferase